MPIKDLIPWNNRGRDVSLRRSEGMNPFLGLHREVNRLFDDVLRGFDAAPFGSFFGAAMQWPQVVRV